jgi:hypothetical protein
VDHDRSRWPHPPPACRRNAMTAFRIGTGLAGASRSAMVWRRCRVGRAPATRVNGTRSALQSVAIRTAV